jgi:hypothetical protein
VPAEVRLLSRTTGFTPGGGSFRRPKAAFFFQSLLCRGPAVDTPTALQLLSFLLSPGSASVYLRWQKTHLQGLSLAALLSPGVADADCVLSPYHASMSMKLCALCALCTLKLFSDEYGVLHLA